MVAGMNANGEPDFYFVKVQGTNEQIAEGEHYERAEREAEAEGYEGPFVGFDENDSAGAAILDCFTWKSASCIVI